MFERPDQVINGNLYVVTSVFNATRYRSRWRLYQDFVKMVEQSGAILYTVEVAFGNREFAVTEPDNPCHIQLRMNSEYWMKEVALNLGVQRLPKDWEYVAIIDCDVDFVRSDWANETVHQLQHHPVIQLWSEAEDLTPDYEHLQTHHSFVYSWLNNEEEPNVPGGYYGVMKKQKGKIFTFHPGYAWGWKRSAWDQVGSMVDFAVLGAADNHMARSLIGEAEKSMHPDIGEQYRKQVLQWQDRALKYIKKDLGYVPGKLIHFFHGKKKQRQYWSRWQILVKMQFDPFTDLKRDWQGLWQLVVESERQQKLRDALRRYFRSRNEDSIDIE